MILKENFFFRKMFIVTEYAALRFTTVHGICTPTPKNLSIHRPIVAFSYHCDMKIVSVVLLQSQNHVLSVSLR